MRPVAESKEARHSQFVVSVNHHRVTLVEREGWPWERPVGNHRVSREPIGSELRIHDI
jgi:hypothetical protein